jgi:hypothetical protein
MKNDTKNSFKGSFVSSPKLCKDLIKMTFNSNNSSNPEMILNKRLEFALS